MREDGWKSAGEGAGEQESGKRGGTLEWEDGEIGSDIWKVKVLVKEVG